MNTYSFLGEEFIIKDYQNAKTFSSFLPAIAGVNGKPLWAFFANVGQVMAGFGVNDKETPITPFDSANLAYQNIALKSFRSFVKINDKLYTPFFKKNPSQTLKISKTDIDIKEVNDDFSYEVSYTTVPFKNYAGLIRRVTIENLLDRDETFYILDGLPVFFPNGLSNFCYKELISLMSAYCEVLYKENKTPFVKFKTSTADNSAVSQTLSGNGYFSVDENNHKLTPIVDLECVFKNDLSLIEPLGFIEDEISFLNYEQQTENKLPCAFSYTKKTLRSHEKYSFISLYAMFDTYEIFKETIDKENYQSLNKAFVDNKVLMDNLLSPFKVRTSNLILDNYFKQSFLDNSLRGGFPIKLTDSEVYYIYSRKHGDMERDYNSFEIPSKYYSSGCGNFRDVNQNRRNDLYFYPYVRDYNVELFFSLISLDGQNPLNVRPKVFVLNDNSSLDILNDIPFHLKNMIINLVKEFEPSDLYTLLKDHSYELNKSYDFYFQKILEMCHQEIRADFCEGYWIDHWTYNVDLLENFLAIYPDLMKDLLKKEIKYFESGAHVRKRSEKYFLNELGLIRQYDALELPLKKYGTSWAKAKDGMEVKSSLLSKIIALIAIKFATLDSLQIGIEMECEKPGWNDAMNGLPGLFGSGISESIELLRLIIFTIEVLPLYEEKLYLYEEQYDLLIGIGKYLSLKENNLIDSFTYWDNVSTLREIFRERVYENLIGKKVEIDMTYLNNLLLRFKKVLNDGILKAKDIGQGIIPSYLYYEVKEYEELDKLNYLQRKIIKVKKFEVHVVPPFLEAPARLLKLGKDYFKVEDYKNIKESDLYDKKLKIYKTCVALDDTIFEIGRIHAFTKGWLERECNFLHMTFKYLLGLLYGGYYDLFYDEMKTNFPCFMDPSIYGRSPLENCSFIVPSCNPNKKIHGTGYFARLTGANAELMQMACLMFVGKNPFRYEDNKLCFVLEPILNKELFDKNKEVSFRFLNSLEIVYHNEDFIDAYYDKVHLTYIVNNIEYESLPTSLVENIRNGKIERLDVVIKK